MSRWLLILFGLLLLIVLGRLDKSEEYSFDLPESNRQEVMARQYSSCASVVAYNK